MPGTETKLTKPQVKVLQRLASSPRGIKWDRLEDDETGPAMKLSNTELVALNSWPKCHILIDRIRITDAGRAALAAATNPPTEK